MGTNLGPRKRNKPVLVTMTSLLGHIAMWAVRQSPYTCPDGIAEVLGSFEELATPFFTEGTTYLPMRTFTEHQLESFLIEYLLPLERVQKWNERKNGNKSPFGVVTATSRPDPDDDFIDLDALAMNIARTTWHENNIEALCDNNMDMLRGLVRAAESLEERDGGKIWDDEARKGLEEARSRGWGKNRVGTLSGEP